MRRVRLAELIKSNVSQAEAARRLGVSEATISRDAVTLQAEEERIRVIMANLKTTHDQADPVTTQ